MNTACKYEWHIPGSPTRVPPLIHEMLEMLSAEINGLSHEEYGDFKLMLNELVFNAILHGNRSDADKFVHIYLTIEEYSVRISITDEGEGFDAIKALSGYVINSDENHLPESGRGMTIVSALADYVEYSNEGRKVTIIKRVGV